MGEWNLATILIGLGVLAIVALVIVKLIKDKKKGKHTCGGGCAGCPNSSACHKRDGGKRAVFFIEKEILGECAIKLSF